MKKKENTIDYHRNTSWINFTIGTSKMGLIIPSAGIIISSSTALLTSNAILITNEYISKYKDTIYYIT